MTLEERRKKVEEIGLRIRDAMAGWFLQPGHDNVTFRREVTNTGAGFLHLEGPVWDQITESIAIELVSQGIIDLEASSCKCDLSLLMARGCQCGEALLDKIKPK